MSATFRHTVTALFAVLLMLFGWASLTPARAQDSGTASTVLIMDASSSMVSPDGNRTRMESAKEAARELVNALPDTANIGLVAYGATESDAPDNYEAGCQDIETLAPVGPLDREALLAGIDGLVPKGYTPMANSLRHAADELPDSGDRSIILVSDGIDSCAPPEVCDVARELANEGVGVAIHTVGFQVDQAAREQLECVADATGGDYHQAGDAGELAETLKFLAQRDLVGYEVTGTPFEFADTIEDAKWLGEGLYQTRVVPTDQGRDAFKYIRIAVPEGHDAYVAVTAIPDREATGSTDGKGDLKYTADDVGSTTGDKCEAKRASVSSGNTYLSAYLPPEPESTAIRYTDDPADCDMENMYLGYNFYWSQYDGDPNQEVAVELDVMFEPRISDEERDNMPRGSSGDRKRDDVPPPAAAPTDITGGSSFNTAVEVAEGRYNDTIVPGEYKFYRMPVEWGEKPLMWIETGDSARGAMDRINAEMYAPIRHGVASMSVTPAPEGDSDFVSLDRNVYYNNRGTNWGGIAKAVAGDYYFGVSMNLGNEEDIRGVDQAYTISFAKEGEPIDGPKWRPTRVNGPEPSDTPPLYDDSTSTTAASSSESVPAQTSTPASETATQTDAAADDSGNSTGTLLLGGGVVLAVIALAGGAFALTRKK